MTFPEVEPLEGGQASDQVAQCPVDLYHPYSEIVTSRFGTDVIRLDGVPFEHTGPTTEMPAVALNPMTLASLSVVPVIVVAVWSVAPPITLPRSSG